MADSLFLKGVKDIRNQTGSEMTLSIPSRGGDTHSIKRWWAKGDPQAYVSCTVFNVNASGTLLKLVINSGTSTELKITHDGSGNFAFSNYRSVKNAAVFDENFQLITAFVFPSMPGVSIVGSVEVETGGSVSLSDLTSGTATAVGNGRPSNNAEIVFPANAIVDSNGIPVDTAIVEIQNIVVSDPNAVDTFPGLFLGNVNGSNVPIESYGFINVNLKDENNNSLSLDPAVGATVRLPVNPDPAGLDVIPTWRLDESTGIWQSTEDANRVGTTNVFEFPVTTFSWYNLDIPIGDTCELTVTAITSQGDGTPVADVDVFVDVDVRTWGPTSIYQGRGRTDQNGEVTLTVPSGYIKVRGLKNNVLYNSEGSLTINTENGSCQSSITIRENAEELIDNTQITIAEDRDFFLNEEVDVNWVSTGTFTSVYVDIQTNGGAPVRETLVNQSGQFIGTHFYIPTTANSTYTFIVEAFDRNMTVIDSASVTATPGVRTTINSVEINGAESVNSGDVENYTLTIDATATQLVYEWNVVGGNFSGTNDQDNLTVTWGVEGDGGVSCLVSSLDPLFDTQDVLAELPVTINPRSFADKVANADVSVAPSVVEVDGNNVYFINGTAQPDITVPANGILHFDLSDPSLAGHPLKIYEDSTKAVEITNNVEQQGTDLIYEDAEDFLTLSYQCENHPNMGGLIIIQFPS